MLGANRQLYRQPDARKRAGFTLVELLVTMSMMAIVTASIFGYSRNNENQNNLNRAEQRLMFEIRRAENLAMNNAKNVNDTLEGKWVRWGILVNNANSYDIVSQTCDLTAIPGGSGDDKGACSIPHTPVSLETIKLPTGMVISANTPSLYFLAPEPVVYKEYAKLELNTPMADFPTFILKNSLSSNEPANTRTIRVTPIGQINGD
ncbi:MAG TPA: prepilin-type N-terminal cleavage/methylation domain-containing protein [Candidatus Paceibacterota bacterium]|nr:prepilin-type N-terminal cleavage/methylation domain-containing protein [Candidatus Paceibacterota bacterium]